MGKGEQPTCYNTAGRIERIKRGGQSDPHVSSCVRQLPPIDLREGSAFQSPREHSHCCAPGTATQPVPELPRRGPLGCCFDHMEMPPRPEEACLAGSGTAKERQSWLQPGSLRECRHLQRPCSKQRGKEEGKNSFILHLAF